MCVRLTHTAILTVEYAVYVLCKFQIYTDFPVLIICEPTNAAYLMYRIQVE